MKSLTEHLNKLINKTSILNITIFEDGGIVLDSIDNKYLNENKTETIKYGSRPITNEESLKSLIRLMKDLIRKYQSSSIQGSTYLEDVTFKDFSGANKDKWKFRISNHRGFKRGIERNENMRIRSFVTKDTKLGETPYDSEPFRPSEEFITLTPEWKFKFRGGEYNIEDAIYHISGFRKIKMKK